MNDTGFLATASAERDALNAERDKLIRQLGELLAENAVDRLHWEVTRRGLTPDAAYSEVRDQSKAAVNQLFGTVMFSVAEGVIAIKTGGA